MDGEDGVLTKNGLREEYKLTTDSDMWSNLVWVKENNCTADNS
jgi:hypothetical protein